MKTKTRNLRRSKKIVLFKPLSKAEFDRLSPAKRRVMIANDVIANLRLDRFRAKSGTYMELDGVGNLEAVSREDIDTNLLNVGLNDLFDSKDPVHLLLNQPNSQACEVCAIGAACCSAVRLFDSAIYNTKTAGEFSMDMWKTIAMYFSVPQYRIMEGWFECWRKEDLEQREDDDQRYVEGITDEWKAMADPERLEAVFTNISANNGTFKPTKNWWRKVMPKSAWERSTRLEYLQGQRDAVKEQMKSLQQKLSMLEDKEAEIYRGIYLLRPSPLD